MTPPDHRPRVVVVGAGVSGLTAAWRLTSVPDPPQVVVLEQSARVGGALLAGELDGVTLDLGAESLLARRPEAVDLVREVGLGEDLVHPVATSAGVVRGRAVHPLPPGTVMGVPASTEHLLGPLTAEEVDRVAREPDLPAPPVDHDVDVASWVAGRVGPAVVDRLVEPLLGGVYAGHAARLSLRATVPALWQRALAGGSVLAAARRSRTGTGPQAAAGPVFAGVAGGLGRLPLRLAELLAARGVEVRTRAAVRGLTRTADGWRLLVGPVPAEQVVEADAVVLALPPTPTARLLAECAPDAARVLADVETASVALVVALLPAAALAGVPGSGLLVPPVEGRPVKAVTFSSAKWAWVDRQTRPAGGAGGRAGGRVAVRLSLGRAGEEAVLQRDDADLTALALADLADLLGRELPVTASRVVRWGGGLPQYAVGHVDRVAAVRAALARVPGLAVCGAAYDGVGVPACVASAGRAAAEVAAHLETLAAPGSEWVP